MNILNEIKNRRSCRSYQEEMVEDSLIAEVVEAGLYAASGMNTQYGKILVITNKELRDKISQMNAAIMGRDGDPFYGAPVILMVVVKKYRNAAFDGACMMENMMLEAASLGLGSCWINRCREELLKEEFISLFDELPFDLHEYEGVGHVALGYPKDFTPREKEILPDRVVYLK